MSSTSHLQGAGNEFCQPCRHSKATTATAAHWDITTTTSRGEVVALVVAVARQGAVAKCQSQVQLLLLLLRGRNERCGVLGRPKIWLQQASTTVGQQQPVAAIHLEEIQARFFFFFFLPGRQLLLLLLPPLLAA